MKRYHDLAWLIAALVSLPLALGIIGLSQWLDAEPQPFQTINMTVRG